MGRSDMTDNAGQIGNVRFPRAGQKAGQQGTPPLGGGPLSGLSGRALPKMTEQDHRAAAGCKKIEVVLKVARARIRRLPRTTPGPQRQQERIAIATDLGEVIAKIYAVMEAS